MDEKIILIALGEMETHSVRFTMDDMTKRLRISKTSLYKMVESKENLIHAAIDYLMAQFEREVATVRGENYPLAEKLRRYVRAYTNAFKYFENGIYGDLKTFYPKEWERWENFRRQKVDNLMTIMQDGINEGVFRPINLAVFQRTLLLVSESLTDEKFLSENKMTYAQAIEQMCDLLFNGFVKN